MFRIESEKSLPAKCLTRYKGLAYDGCWFYLTVSCECKVIRFDSCFHDEKSFDTCRSYSCIGYDFKEKCFWASEDRCLSTIFKLDKNFHEIDSIPIRTSELYGGLVTGISYNCCDDTLLVSLAGGVARVSKQHPKDSVTLMKSYREWVFGVVSICPYFICYSIAEQKKTIHIYSCDGKLIKDIGVPYELIIESAVFVPCVKDSTNCHFYVLISKRGCYSYILDCLMECDVLSEEICDCNYEICNSDSQCDESCEHKRCCSDVLESIALVEASIAHILNEEGEKLQKAISSTDDINKIMDVNNSVNKTIVNTTHLEHILYNKLEVLTDYCDFCENDKLCNEIAENDAASSEHVKTDEL